jgi:hypothetical protein
MKPTIRKHKNARGRIISYAADIGPIGVFGDTPPEASAACEKAVLVALGRLDRGGMVGRWRGHMYTIEPTCFGWRYWLDTFVDLDYRCQVAGDREDAQDSVLHHLAQNVWEHDVDDETFVKGLSSGVAARISEWIGFQRRYAEHKAAGRSDNECHQFACEGLRAADVTEARHE